MSGQSKDTVVEKVKQKPVSRRQMLKGMFFTVAATPLTRLIASRTDVEAPIEPAVRPELMEEIWRRPRHTAMIGLTVNGKQRWATVEHRTTLLEMLRDQLDVTGPKRGCDRAQCGACSVLLDGELVYSCSVLAKETDGREVVSVEGLGTPDNLGPVQQAFVEKMGMQCGFCTPGMIVATHYLLNQNPSPSRREIKEGLSGNICRCPNYEKIFESVERAAELMRA